MTEPPPAATPIPTLFILWGALFAATFVYLGVFGFVAPTPALAPDPMLVPVFAFVSLLVAAISFWLPRKLLKDGLTRLELPVTDVPDPNASVMFRDRTPTIRVFVDPNRARREVLRVFFTPFILGMALSEAVALFGFVLGFLGNPITFVLPFFVASWLLMLPRIPFPTRIFSSAEKMYNARFVDNANAEPKSSSNP